MNEIDTTSWDLWIDEPHDPAWNMAADEVLLDTAPGRGRPLLRIYGWDRPAVSIGYFQPAREGDATGLPWVRRTTGGGIVRHDRDQTYTVVVPSGHPLHTAPLLETYRLFNRCVVRALERLGLEARLSSAPMPRHTDLRTMVCFDQPTRYDVLCGDRKVAGAAQRRTRTGILHQGSIAIDGIAGDVAGELVPGFAGELAVRFLEFRPDPRLLARIRERVAERYGLESWNRQR